MRLPAAWSGLLVLAAILAAAEWLAARRPPWLALRMLAAAAAGLALARIVPWGRLLLRAARRPFLRNSALYFLFLGHFVGVFFEETLSLFRAWKLAAPNRWRRVAWRSLALAAASLFPRALRRAERFYASLLVNGLAR
ncbi:MAG: hypothetical protein WHT08_10230 [Bryobacteraceae bacterium]